MNVSYVHGLAETVRHRHTKRLRGCWIWTPCTKCIRCIWSEKSCTCRNGSCSICGSLAGGRNVCYVFHSLLYWWRTLREELIDVREGTWDSYSDVQLIGVYDATYQQHITLQRPPIAWDLLITLCGSSPRLSRVDWL